MHQPPSPVVSEMVPEPGQGCSPIVTPFVVPALLVCGAAGSGRTSVAKEIARRLEADPAVYARGCLERKMTLPITLNDDFKTLFISIYQRTAKIE